MNTLETSTGTRHRQRDRAYLPELVESSPLRRFDPRTKLALSTLASLAVMLPLERLVIFMALYAGLLTWAHLTSETGRQLRRLKWLLIALFFIDWLVLGLDLATLITLRVVLLASVFTLFVGTTTPGEFRLALETLGVHYRYAFSLSLAFQTLPLLRSEWGAIQEAQVSRGLTPLQPKSIRSYLRRVSHLVALTVPAIVLTTRRAWSITEAAYARGFGSPHRRLYRQLRMRGRDWLLIGAALVVMTALLLLG
ncbi:MAG: energy-coupling factor transporter transmembrane component T family protein [Anaerolineae bacterium]